MATMDDEIVWMRPPFTKRADESVRRKVAVNTDLISQLMVAGWKQCEPPAVETEQQQEVITNAMR